jgi:putative transposase
VARRKSIGVRQQLTSLVPGRRIDDLARTLGLVERQRKVDAKTLFWTVVKGFAVGGRRTLAGLRRLYEKASGVKLVPSAFYDRFNEPLAALFRAVLAELLTAIQLSAQGMRGVLESFRDVLLADATIVKLHDWLGTTFPGTRGTKAQAKLHLVMSAKGMGPRTVRITAGRRHELRVLRIGRWVRDHLLLFDLGYFKFQLFDRISRNGGFFISRLKAGVDPFIVKAHRQWRGQSVPVVGHHLSAVLDRLQRSELDVEVEVSFQRRAYRGRQSEKTAKLRLVAVYNQEARRYHTYLTNVPEDRLSAQDVAKTYGARWQIELIFNELKTRYRLEQLPSRKKHIVEALLLATLVTLIASRSLLAAVRQKLAASERRVPEGRWAAIFEAYAADLLRLLVAPVKVAKGLALYLEDVILHEALDPNPSRPHLLGRLESATA